MIPRLKELYKKQIQVDLKNQFGLKKYINGSKNTESCNKYGIRCRWK